MNKPIVRAIDCHIVKSIENELLYLLLKRAPGELYPDIWQCVTGKIKPNEKAFQTAIREVKEETGLSSTHLWTLEHVNLFFEGKQDRMNLIPVFGMQVGNEDVILSKEHSRFKWCSFEEAVSLLLWAQQKKGLETFHSMLNGSKEKLTFSKIY